MSRDNILFEDRFECIDVDADGKKFDRVSRITAQSDNLNTHITLDHANELIQFAPRTKFTLCLARSLDNSGGDDDDDAGGVDDRMNVDKQAGRDALKAKREMWRGGEQGLAEEYDYVMYGKIYKFEDASRGTEQTTAYISFGGLLLALRGPYRHMQKIMIGDNVFLLIRK